jgi:hypothetical protein
MGGSLKGSTRAPPLIIEPFEIEEIAARLERALDDVANELMREGALG